MKLKSIYFYSFIFIVNFSFSQENWEIIDKTDYSIMYPENWENKNIKDYPGVDLILYAGEHSSEKDGFAESLNVVKEDISSYNINLNEYIEEILRKLNNAYDIEILKNEAIKTNYYILEYSINFNDKVIKTKQHCWLKNHIIYALSFSTTDEEFTIYDKLSDEILNSFKLK